MLVTRLGTARITVAGRDMFANDFCAGIAQLVEHQTVDLVVTGSNPVPGTNFQKMK